MDIEKDSNREAFDEWHYNQYLLENPNIDISNAKYIYDYAHKNVLVCQLRESHFTAWQAAKAQVVPDGFVLVPTTPSCEMWSGIARDLGRYMQMHDRYCPKSLKKYFDRFIGEIPEWLNKEVEDWDSDHAFATADLPAFIYMSMVEAQEPAND